MRSVYPDQSTTGRLVRLCLVVRRDSGRCVEIDVRRVCPDFDGVAAEQLS